MTTELLKQALSAMRDVADLMADRWPMDTQQRAPKFFQAMRDIDAALSKPASEDAWLVEAEWLIDGAIVFSDETGNSGHRKALTKHLRARPAREGFVSVPVEQAKDGELFRSLKWRFEEDRDMGPGGRWWVSVSTNDPKIRNDLRKVLIEAAKGDTNG